MAELVNPPVPATTKSLGAALAVPERPHPVRTAASAAHELAMFVRHVPTMRAHSTEHDRQPVLVLPGFLAHDALTLGMRMVLNNRDHPTYGWKLGVNVGPLDYILRGIRKRLVNIADRHEQPVSVIGWSLGGLYARQLARESPELVRQVITLGSPINLTLNEIHVTAVQSVMDPLKRFFSKELDIIGQPEHEKPQLTVPATAVYTRGDEVVPWESCLDLHGAPHLSENIEVRGTHLGLAQNRAATHVVLDRLALPYGKWAHFQPDAKHAHHYPIHHALMQLEVDPAAHDFGR